MSEQNKIDEITEDLNEVADEVWEKDVFDVITNQDGKIIAEVFDKDAAQLFAKSNKYITYLLQEIERKDEALKKIAEYDVSEEHGTVDEWSESQGFTECQRIAREAL